MTRETNDGATWAPDACTLPAEERPLRMAEFDDLFATAVHRIDRVHATRLRLVLDGAAETEAVGRDLAARESDCCSFFTFAFQRDGDEFIVDIEVPRTRSEILDGLGARALAALEGRSR